MNTAPDYPDLPALFAAMRAADGVDEPRPPRRLAAFRELARQQTAQQRQAAVEYVHRVQLGIDALELGMAFVDQGDLEAAARWFTIAERYGAEGAAEELRSVQLLQAAFAEPGVPDDTVLGPPALEQRPHDEAGVRGISTYTLDWADREAERITSEAQASAAAILRDAEASAAELLADAEAAATRIRDEATREAETIRAHASVTVHRQPGLAVTGSVAAQDLRFSLGAKVWGSLLCAPDLQLAKPALWTVPGDWTARRPISASRVQEQLMTAWSRRLKTIAEAAGSHVARWCAVTAPRQRDATPRLFVLKMPMLVDHCQAGPFERWVDHEDRITAMSEAWSELIVFVSSSEHCASAERLGTYWDHITRVALVDECPAGAAPPPALPTRWAPDDAESVVTTDLSAI